jgi:hypothetical protein
VSRKKNSRQWARLRVLCSGSLHLMTLIPDALELVRGLIPSSASQLFLLAEQDAAQHPTADPGNLAQLGFPPARERRAGMFDASAEFSGVLPPPNGYFYRDAAQFGAAPATAPEHVLEVPLDVSGKRVGAITLFRDSGAPFDADDAEDLGRVANYFEHALKTGPAPAAGLSGVIEDEAMLLATTAGEILFLSDSAGALLDQLALQERHAFDRKTLPPFCMRLLESVVYGDRYPWALPSHTLALAGGALEARAQWMRSGGASALDTADMLHSRMVGIFLKFVVPMPLRIWRALGTVELSPQQTEVAYWMGVGGDRDAARANMDVSDAVLRDCVKAVYEKFGCTSEAGLLALLRPAVSRM